jgi:hypothetical protein
LKNQTQRVEDAKAATRKTKRPRIGDQKRSKEPTPEERERAKNRALMKVDVSARILIDQLKRKQAIAAAAREGDPLNQPFKTDRERIKFNTSNFADLSVAEAFAKNYNLKLKDVEIGNDVPTELSVGDVIALHIASISKKGGVVFDPGSYKENFATRNNLARYSKFEHFRPLDAVQARVIEITPKTTMVDVFSPMIDSFLVPRAQAPWTQNKLVGAIPVKVKNLRLVRGGYIGQAVIPNISEFVGEDFVIDAFVPGSQIVLNATEDFESFVGQDVDTFVTSWALKPNGRGMSLVCSAKNYLRHKGNLILKEIHEMWCDAGEEWNDLSSTSYKGVITGVLNSAKKCGVFVEIPEHNITGMIQVPAEELVNYKAGEEISVKYKTLEEDLIYNDAVGQMQHAVPFEIVDGAIKRVNVKPIFEVA